VTDWLRSHPGCSALTVTLGTSLEQALRRMLSQPCARDVYVVTAQGRVVGHLSHRKLAYRLLAEHSPTHTRRQLMERVAGGSAEDLMDQQWVSARPDDELEDVLPRLLEQEIEDIPVVDDGGILLGAINLSLVLREKLAAAGNDAEAP
jgi:CBS domain-containing protein